MNPQKLKTVFFFLLLFAITMQSQNYQLSHFSLNDGLPQSQVNDVIQDDFGYLWVATDGGGTARFDGNKFVVFDEEDGLISNYVNSINFIADRLFVSTKKGLSIKDGEELFSYKSPEINKLIAVGTQVFLATNDGLRYFESLEISLKLLDSVLDNSQINDLFYDEQSLWLASEIGLFEIKNIDSNSPVTKKWNDFNIVTLVADKKNNLYFATKINGVFEFDKTAGEEKKIAAVKNINSLYVDSITNQLIVSTNKVGILTINLKTGHVKTAHISELHKLNIYKTVLDSESNQWIASSNGLYKLSKSSFKQYLKSQTITAIHPKRDSVFIATADGSLFYLDSLGTNKIPDFYQNIYALNSNLDGQIFAGTDDGILVLDSLKVADTIRYVKDVQKIILKDSVFWIASTTQGVGKFRYDFESKKITDTIRFKTSDGLYDLSINDMQLDNENRLWYISNKGFLGFIKEDVVHHLGRKLANNATIGSIVTHNNTIFLGTHGEGIWWSKLSEKPRFKLLRGKKRLPNKNVYQLGFDSQDNLWVGLQNGVAQIELSENNTIVDLHYFDKYDGFAGGETMQNVIAQDNSSNSYFGTIQGLIKYEPAGKSKVDFKPIVYFEYVEMSYQKLDSVGKKEYNFSPTENHLSFSFKTVDVNHPNEIEYRWRLNTEEWSDWSENSFVVFPSLISGNYHFEAQSKTANQIVSDPIEFLFFIDTALFNKGWFRLVLGVGILLLLFFIGWIYFRNIKIKNNIKQEKLKLENKLLDLEQKALRLQMNPHFIFNVLNGIKALGATDIKKMNTAIQQFASLMRSTLHNSRQENISLKEEVESLKYYLELEQLMGAKEFKFDINIDEKLDAEEVLLAPMILQPFVENAIEHGISKVERGGEVSIKFELISDQLYCEIRDNGVGYQQALAQEKISGHQSVAIEVTKERIKMISENNNFKIEEIRNDENHIAGTIVSFNLPLMTDY